MKNILILNGHPNPEAYNYALAAAYRRGAEQASAQVKQINIAELDFDPNLKHGYQKRIELEPDLEAALALIKEADHLVWVYPIWWYSIPAVMKGFIDRTFLPGITFKYQAGKPFPKQLLKGKTARIICTSDTPYWYYWLYMKSPTTNQMKKGVLEFCGVKPVKVSYIAPIKDSTEAFRKKHLDKVEALGRAMR